jgi:hypothetical protein
MTQDPAVTLDTRSVRRSGGVWRGALFYGLIAPPLVWAIQLYLNFGLASHACFPGEAPRANFVSGWERIWTVLLLVNLVCAAICAIGLLASGFCWRRLRKPPAIAGGTLSEPIHGADERLRSFAIAGLMVSGLFTAAILFNTLYLWALSTCSQA